MMRTGRTGTPSTSSASRPASRCRHEQRLRRHRHRRRLAGRALRRCARPRAVYASHSSSARLVGGECSYWACIPSKTLLRPGEAVHGANDAAATARVDVEAALAWRDFMVSNYSDAGQQRWLAEHGIDLLRGRGPSGRDGRGRCRRRSLHGRTRGRGDRLRPDHPARAGPARPRGHLDEP